MSGLLLLIKHSGPAVEPGRSPRTWKLSDEGRNRAGNLAEHLQKYQPKAIVSSDEPKAVETAQIAAKSLGLISGIQPNLHEHRRDSAGFLDPHEFRRAVAAFFDHPGETVFGEESADAAYDRFNKAVQASLAGCGPDTLALVSHGTVISLYVSRQAGIPAFPLWLDLGLPSIAVFETVSRSLLEVINIEKGGRHGSDRPAFGYRDPAHA